MTSKRSSFRKNYVLSENRQIDVRRARFWGELRLLDCNGEVWDKGQCQPDKTFGDDGCETGSEGFGAIPSGAAFMDRRAALRAAVAGPQFVTLAGTLGWAGAGAAEVEARIVAMRAKEASLKFMLMVWMMKSWSS